LTSRELGHRFVERTEPLRPGLHRYCRSLTGSVWDAEDLVQDTLLRAFAKLGEIRQEIASPKAYLLRIASNLWIDRVRRPEAPAPNPIATAEDPSRPVEVRDAARELMSWLSPQEGAAFVSTDPGVASGGALVGGSRAST
jgi:RNA polymerase sigma-70 factor, ECF subfamily